MESRAASRGFLQAPWTRSLDSMIKLSPHILFVLILSSRGRDLFLEVDDVKDESFYAIFRNPKHFRNGRFLL